MAVSELSIEAISPRHPEQHEVLFYKPNPPADKLVAGYVYDVVVGTLVIIEPAAATDLRLGVVNGSVTGTLSVPSPSDVIAGVPTDDTVGTLVLLTSVPSPANVSTPEPPPAPIGVSYV